MGIFDYIKDVSDALSTRRGREDLLGIPANKKDRKLKARAIQEFNKKYPEFRWFKASIDIAGIPHYFECDNDIETTDYDSYIKYKAGDITDYDGYIQYKKGKNYYCGLFEGRRNVYKNFSYIKEHINCDEIRCEVIENEQIPEIKVLLKSYRSWQELIHVYSTSFKINYAYCWYRSLRDELTSPFPLIQVIDEGEDSIPIDESTFKWALHPDKKKAFEKLKYLMVDGEIPYGSIDEISRLDSLRQLLVLADVLNRMQIKPLFDDLPCLPVTEVDYKNSSFFEDENQFWKHLFFKKFHFNNNLENLSFNICSLIKEDNVNYD
jgi:hypothetical protein